MTRPAYKKFQRNFLYDSKKEKIHKIEKNFQQWSRHQTFKRIFLLFDYSFTFSLSKFFQTSFFSTFFFLFSSELSRPALISEQRTHRLFSEASEWIKRFFFVKVREKSVYFFPVGKKEDRVLNGEISIKKKNNYFFFDIWSQRKKKISQILFYNLQLSEIKIDKNYFAEIAFSNHFYSKNKAFLGFGLTTEQRTRGFTFRSSKAKHHYDKKTKLSRNKPVRALNDDTVQQIKEIFQKSILLETCKPILEQFKNFSFMQNYSEITNREKMWIGILISSISFQNSYFIAELQKTINSVSRTSKLLRLTPSSLEAMMNNNQKKYFSATKLFSVFHPTSWYGVKTLKQWDKIEPCFSDKIDFSYFPLFKPTKTFSLNLSLSRLERVTEDPLERWDRKTKNQPIEKIILKTNLNYGLDFTPKEKNRNFDFFIKQQLEFEEIKRFYVFFIKPSFRIINENLKTMKQIFGLLSFFLDIL